MKTTLSPLPAPGTKILFACFPVDGHFNPLTGLAKHLISIGCDVRWYSSHYFARRLDKLDIPYYVFKQAKELDITHLDDVFPERKKIKGKVKKLNFDMVNVFISRGPEYYEDLQSIREVFPFELMIADMAFMGIPFVKDKMNIPVVSIGIAPLPLQSKDLAPYGLGITPAASAMGKIKHRLLRWLAAKVLFAKSNRVLDKMLAGFGINSGKLSLFDLNVMKSSLMLQIGSPGFEYQRSDMPGHVKFVGGLLPYAKQNATIWYDEKLSRYENVILVTQGTVEKDITKLVVPALEAFKDTNALLIVTTGGSHTAELKEKYPHSNVIIEDFIPFNDVMPHANVYITNGGYGGVLLSISHKVPMVVAGVHEGKNEINARVGYFELGVNLDTETPSVEQLRKAVQQVLEDNRYASNTANLCNELQQYQPLDISTQYIGQLLSQKELYTKKTIALQAMN